VSCLHGHLFITSIPLINIHLYLLNFYLPYKRVESSIILDKSQRLLISIGDSLTDIYLYQFRLASVFSWVPFFATHTPLLSRSNNLAM